MTAWSIDPEGVVGVLTTINADAETFSGVVGQLTSSLGSAVQYTASGPIGAAVQDYIDRVDGPRLQGIGDRIVAAGGGVVAATQAYVDGDLAMAAQAQQIAYDTVYPPPLPHGVI